MRKKWYGISFLQEICAVRQKLKKGVGSRGINNEHLRKLKSGGLDFGIQFYVNILFYFIYWPSDYRLAHIFPLLKGGLRKIWEVSDYRGISILDTMWKEIEEGFASNMREAWCAIFDQDVVDQFALTDRSWKADGWFYEIKHWYCYLILWVLFFWIDFIRLNYSYVPCACCCPCTGLNRKSKKKLLLLNNPPPLSFENFSFKRGCY